MQGPKRVRRHLLEGERIEVHILSVQLHQAREQSMHRKAASRDYCIERLTPTLQRDEFGFHLAHQFSTAHFNCFIDGLAEEILVSLPEVANESPLVGLRIVNQAAKLIEPLPPEAVEHHVDCCAFFADKEHAF